MQVTICRDNWLYMQEHVQNVRGNQQTSFAEDVKQAVDSTGEALLPNEVLDKLSDKAVELLKSMKADSSCVSNADWTDLITELRDTGAIT